MSFQCVSPWKRRNSSHLLPVSAPVINVMVDPDGTLDALASLGLASPTTPTQPQTNRTAPSSTTGPASAPAAKQPLPEILPGPGGPTPRVQSSPGKEESVRDLGVGLGLSFSRMRPSGEEAIAQK